MITIQIQCKDINEFRQYSSMLSGEVNLPSQQVAVAKVAPPKKTTTKAPPKSEVVLPEEADVPLETQPEVEAPKANVSKTVTKDMIAKALQDLNTKKGIAAARAVLAEFECGKMSDLGADQYTEFLQACEAATV